MEMEQYHIHEHPLTLCEEEGELFCYGCGECFQASCCCSKCGGPLTSDWFFKSDFCARCYSSCISWSYSCSKCRFHPDRCFACDGKPSGSFYICKQCWPESPYFHKSCAELPQQIQIAHRPHCSLQLKGELITISKMFTSQRNLAFVCDFCNQSRTGYKWCCYLCNFHICAECVTVLIKYHKGQEYIEHASHQHPLNLLDPTPKDIYREFKCMICDKKIDVLSYCCAPCKFYIHKSCGELPQEVRHPSHPRHSLYITILKSLESCRCDACGDYFYEAVFYRCGICDFSLHLECMSLKPNIKYRGHQHLLYVVENKNFFSKCQDCLCEIRHTFYVRCLQCRLDFHVQCGPTWLPQTVVLKHHDHPLTLTDEVYRIGDDFNCLCCDVFKEERNPNHSFYYCVECKYYAHVRCVFTELPFDEREKLEHFSHHHFLFLVESKIYDEITCYACGKLIHAHPAYGCDDCRFYLHKSCVELPRQIQHLLHQHPPTLQSYPYDGTCNACGKHLSGLGLVYRCESCDFNLDLDCTSQHPSMKFKACNDKCNYIQDGESIGHYSHYHHLTLLEVEDIECKLCSKNIYGQSYGCAPCTFYIHKSCGDLQQEVRHPFHPLHSLKLTLSNRHRCEVCCFYVNPGLCYSCDECEFEMHLECVSLKPNIKYEYHQHLLILVENLSCESKCQTCRCKIEGTFFARCVECRLDFHVQCGCGPTYLPPTLVHNHHDHPLTLSNETIVKDDYGFLCCDVCKEERNPNHPSYFCVECECYMHVGCVLTEVPLDEREKLEHFSHDHLLFLESRRNDDIACYACGRLIQPHPAYGCDCCRFYLHKSCTELPRQIQHAFHRHPLNLESHTYKDTESHLCIACHKKLYDFTYQCRDCDFVLDIDCATLQLRAKFEGGEHILSFFEKLQHIPKCQQFIYTTGGQSYLHCLKCNFIVYLLHSPLPRTIECTSHLHSLTLMDHLACDDYYTQVCDVCEEERDAGGCVYCCEECDFIAEFDCVIYEVIQALQKRPPDTQLRSINRNKAMSKSLTLKDIEDSFTDEEKKKLEDVQQGFNQEKEAIASISDKDLLRLLAVSSEKDTVEILKTEDFESQLINVGDHKTIPKLAIVLKNLLNKYGDVTGDSCSSNIKTHFMVCFCATVHSMCNTMIQDVNNGLIYTWWKNFKLVQRAGFRIEFVFDHLQRITQARRRIDGADHQLYQSSPIRYHYEEMTMVSKEIDELSKEVDKRTTKMDQIRRQAEDLIANIGLGKLRFETEQLSETKEMGMMKAGRYTGLL